MQSNYASPDGATATLVPPTIAPQITDAVLRGWSVIPVGIFKKPLLKSWHEFQDQPASIELVREWADTLKPPAWAVVTGKVSGLFVLDFDGMAGLRLARDVGLGGSCHVFTPSCGLHMYVSTDGVEFPVKNQVRALPGLDIRGEGGYAVFHGKALGGDYIWIQDDITPEPWGVLPLEILEVLGPTSTAEVDDSVVDDDFQTADLDRVNSDVLLGMALTRARRGYGRNDSGFWLALQLRDNRYSYRESKDILMSYLSQVPDTNTKGHLEPYTEQEALHSLDESYSRAPRGPWGAAR